MIYLRTISAMMKATGTPDSGFLVTYSGAKLGFSFRSMRANYTGVVVRMKKTSNGDEVDFYLGAGSGELNTIRGGGGFAPSDIITGTDDARVMEWYSWVNGIYAYQTDVTKMPMIMIDGAVLMEGGYPTILFDGSNDCLELSTPVSAGNFTCFVVTKRTAAGTPGIALITDDVSGGDAGRGYTNYRYTDDGQYVHNSQGVIYPAGSSTTTSLELLSAYMDASSVSNSDLYINNSLVSGRGQVTVGGAAQLTTIGYRASGSEYGNGKLSELLFWESLRSDISTIGADIKTAYGL